MGNPNQFAVLQTELAGATADQLKRAFTSFSNLTDADAVRLAVGARGILMRGLGHDAARALVLALQAEGVGAVVIAEADLPRLPETRVLRRLELSADAFTFYDVLQRPTVVAWQGIALVAVAAVRHFEMTTYQTERTKLQLGMLGLGPKKIKETAHKVESDSQLLLEIVLSGTTARFQINAALFPFKYLIDRPGLSTEQKFIWLVREICRNANQAVLNDAARSLVEGQETVPVCRNRQAFADEVLWLVWQSTRNSG